MKTRVNTAQTPDEIVGFGVTASCSDQRDGFPIEAHLLEDMPDLVGHRDDEFFARIRGRPFRVCDDERPSGKVGILHPDFRLAEPAPSIKRNAESAIQPHRRLLAFVEQAPDFLIGQFAFLARWHPADTQPRKWVGLTNSASDGFVQQVGQEFYFQQGGVVRAPFGSPAKVFGSVFVANLAWDVKTVLLEKVANRGPRVSESSAVPSRLGGAVVIEKRGNPVGESRAGIRDRDATPQFLGNPDRLSGVGSGIDAQARGLLSPCSGVLVSEPNVPERGSGVSSNGCHVSLTRSHIRGVESSDFRWASVGHSGMEPTFGILPLHHQAT